MLDKDEDDHELRVREQMSRVEIDKQKVARTLKSKGTGHSWPLRKVIAL
ncbi:hypothetical protein BWQ96_06763 [Gracilariopsis chorda]|uniref:Uncharacterized protein n=1 Tax=Gracilariopsis chorda TaxID=448386 RepID=A0A2V3IQP3_9FLOR|nr:hypothetical protein BWQ96_06763 [Gracilariopsis chorda]|eukprot:PXF43470.1 hypothetical protein BWQ96_06763 [Gracilariopsis chorda]